MSKNILLISSTPRENGNTDLFCDEFMRGAQTAGHKVEKIRLAEKNINYCTGCCFCVSNQGTCVQQDDMPEILKKILDADVLVLATPVYFHAMNGQMKTFIDRTCPISTLIRDKEIYFAVAAAGSKAQVESTVESLRVYTRTFSGIREKGVMSVTGVWDAGGVKGTPALEQAYTMGLNS